MVYSSEAVLTNHYEIRKAQQVGKQEEGGNVWNLPFLYNSMLANAIFKKKHFPNLTVGPSFHLFTDVAPRDETWI